MGTSTFAGSRQRLGSCGIKSAGIDSDRYTAMKSVRGCAHTPFSGALPVSGVSPRGDVEHNWIVMGRYGEDLTAVGCCSCGWGSASEHCTLFDWTIHKMRHEPEEEARLAERKGEK